MLNLVFSRFLHGPRLGSARRQRGFTLVEAMVGVVIFSVGFLSLAGLESELLSSTGESKARTEAAQVAERQVEKMRAYLDRGEFDALKNITTTPINVGGTNANYQVVRTVSTVNDDLLDVDVAVSWTPARGETQTVRLQTQIGWDSNVAGARAAGGGIGPAGDSDTRRGDFAYDDIPDGAKRTDETGLGIALPDTETAWDGTYLYENDEGGIELIDTDGQVLLINDAGEAFSSVSGIFYIDTDGLKKSVDATTVELRAYGTSACQMVRPDSDPTWELDSAGAPQYEFFAYRCYVPPRWYGSVYIVRSGNVANEERIWVGEAGVDEDADRMDSRHPQMSSLREYRGYVDEGNDFPATIGIGMDSGEYNAVNYFEHDFLLTGIDTVTEFEDRYLDYSPSTFAGNPGYGFCFTPDFCPPVLEDVTANATVVTVTVDPQGYNNTNQYETAISQVPFVEMDTAECVGSPADFDCTVTRTGWDGEAWSGVMQFYLEPDMTICGGEVTKPTSDPDEFGTVVYGTDGLEFDGINPKFEEIEVTVTVGKTAADCP